MSQNNSGSGLSSTAKLFLFLFAIGFGLLGCLIFGAYTGDIVDALQGGASIEDLLVIYGYAPSPTPTPRPRVPQANVGACLEGNQLTVSVQFDMPVTGDVSIQVFSSAGNYFVSQPETTGFQQTTDLYESNAAIIPPVVQLDFVIPTVSMPVGAGVTVTFRFDGSVQGSIVEGAIVEQSNLTVLECRPVEAIPPSPTFTPSPTLTPNPDGVPVIINFGCLSSQQFMVVFEFEQPVLGEYEAFVNDVPYELTPFPTEPARLYFIGAAIPGGGFPVIVLKSLPDQLVVLERSDYPTPQCEAPQPTDDGGDDNYTPPTLPPDGY